jgi:hypothetical protein
LSELDSRRATEYCPRAAAPERESIEKARKI